MCDHSVEGSDMLLRQLYFLNDFASFSLFAQQSSPLGTPVPPVLYDHLPAMMTALLLVAEYLLLAHFLVHHHSEAEPRDRIKGSASVSLSPWTSGSQLGLSCTGTSTPPCLTFEMAATRSASRRVSP